jgi:O-antigen/teichoic acid export membrane protein
VLPPLFGGAFRASLVPLWVMLPGQCAANVATVVSYKLMADNRPGAASAGLVVAAVVTVAGLAIAIRPFGILGAAAVTTASQVSLLAYVAAALFRGGARNVALDSLASAEAPAG